MSFLYNMKVIVSHDVDHLYVSEHWKDLFFPKMWARSFIELIRGQISVSVFWNRLLSIFDRQMHRIPELITFDEENGVKATYFFGMASALGMAYTQKKAQPWIKYVKERGCDAGVHGCDYQHIDSIKHEHDDFAKLTGDRAFGIRNHYVRYDGETFNKMNQAGYLFDTSEFNKECPTYKEPYKVGNMWEFPLAIMEGYVVRHDLEAAKDKTLKFISETLIENKGYLTILFHDIFFNEKCYPVEKAFYEWLIEYLKSMDLVFVSYRDAIKELENDREYKRS